MKRPTEEELRDLGVFGQGIIGVLTTLNVKLEELPDIMPDRPEDSAAFNDYVMELLRSKGMVV